MSKLYKKITKNTRGNDYAVGDIHGEFHLLDQKLVEIGFDKTKDRLFSVGDMVDRGKDSELFAQYLQEPWFYAVRGNHEDMAIAWASDEPIPHDNYMGNGGEWHIRLTQQRSQEIATLLSTLPIALEIPVNGYTVGVVHAACPYPDWESLEQALQGQHGEYEQEHAYQMSIWMRKNRDDVAENTTKGIDMVVVGHQIIRNKKPHYVGNTLYIDTGAFITGKISVVCLNKEVETRLLCG